MNLQKAAAEGWVKRLATKATKGRKGPIRRSAIPGEEQSRANGHWSEEPIGRSAVPGGEPSRDRHRSALRAIVSPQPNRKGNVGEGDRRGRFVGSKAVSEGGGAMAIRVVEAVGEPKTFTSKSE